jgi:uncharacterized lipoprotein
MALRRADRAYDMSALPRKRTVIVSPGMSAKCQKQTFQSPAGATTTRTLRISGSLKIKRPSPFMGA